jgi:acyl-CoA synthetase (AMP-forming)/AMP-acid ligase II
MTDPVVSRILTRLDVRQTGVYYQSGWWREESLYSLFAGVATTDPARVAFREWHRSVSYAELFEAVDRLAGHLREQGLTSGDRVAVWLPTRVEVAVAALACAREGLICAPSLHRDHTVGQVMELLARMHAAGFIGERGYGADAARNDIFMRLGELPSVRVSLVLEPTAQGMPLFGTVPAGERATASSATGAPSDAVAYLAFTSGSTGLPKGVLHSSNTLLAPIRAMAQDWGFRRGSVLYSLSPLSHNLGFGAMLMALCLGGTLVGHDLPRGSGVAQRMLQTKTMFAFGVPTHVIDLLGELDRGEVSELPDLVGFRVSGASVSREIAQRMLDYGVVPQSGYGMTEAGNFHYTRPHDASEIITGSSGRPFPGHEVRIVAQEEVSRELPRGEVGQILARGPSIMLGYFDDQLATEQAFTEDGWLMTGDLGWVDEADNVRITGRKKDVIIRGGHNIFPARIENLTVTMPGVARAAAIPVADERLGEKVCLVVAYTSPRDDVDADALLHHLDQVGLSKYDMPEYVAVVDDIPLLPSGKLDKRSLIELLDAGELEISPVRFRPAS